MKTSFTVLFLANSIQALVRQSDGKFQILNNETCLTLQTSGSTYLATDPSTQLQNFYPIAEYSPCDVSNEQQWFEVNSDSQLEADNFCLTPLPVDASTHANLDSCDTWTSFTGVGSYLFSLPCNVADGSQVFTFLNSANGLSKIFQSGCVHGLFLGATGQRGILTGDSYTFPTAEIVTGIVSTPDLTVELKSRLGANTVLDSLLTDAQLDDVLDHGCYCQRFDRTYTLANTLAPKPVDQLDRICKKWAQMRRCNNIAGGSCAGYDMSNNYTITQTVDNAGAVQFECDNSDSCMDDSCVIDMTFGLEVLEFLESNPTFTPSMTTVNECLASSDTNGQVMQRVCGGTAPNLEFQIVVI
jgi:hypothetical protein